MIVESFSGITESRKQSNGSTNVGGEEYNADDKILYWQDNEMWLGFLEEYPVYATQGETKEELEENLRDIHNDLTNGSIPCVRRLPYWKCYEANGKGELI